MNTLQDFIGCTAASDQIRSDHLHVTFASHVKHFTDTNFCSDVSPFICLFIPRVISMQPKWVSKSQKRKNESSFKNCLQSCMWQMLIFGIVMLIWLSVCVCVCECLFVSSMARALLHSGWSITLRWPIAYLHEILCFRHALVLIAGQPLLIVCGCFKYVCPWK